MIALMVVAHDVVVRATAWRHTRHLNRLDDVARTWAAVPSNWCARPGCSRCFGGA
ncbi:hypothetical protein [Streptosporangium sp. NPDC048865]|uniref:hypothetical protein n=1 Tax=Streptosporangium sp. NPDC048865 TaxID=3155766 RepID=UPI00344799DB